MNLTHLFNKDFFIQNIKKSKAFLVFALILMPAFTALFLLSINSFELQTIHFAEAGFFNIFFMYIVPIMISLSLFDLYFKKQSCDFIGSMPLSRKTIFTTNTIGGIILIVAMQLITALMILVFSLFLPNLIIFKAMIWDMFLFFTVSYIFVFVACNLAFSFSGNRFAVIACTLLIIFLIPFTLACARYKENRYDNYSTSKGIYTYYESFNFTAPSMIFDIEALDEYSYNGIAVLKMIVLSVAYYAIGLKLFERKKLEMAGESFENEKTHLVVKMLTLSPFAAFISMAGIENLDALILFVLAFIMVYYYLFDMVTNKKVKFRVTAVTFVASCFIMYAFYDLVVPHLDFIGKKSFEISDVDSLTVTELELPNGNMNEFEITITNKELIEKLFDATYLYDYDYTSSYYPAYLLNPSAIGVATLPNGRKYNIQIDYLNSFKEIAKECDDTPFIFDDKLNTIVLNGQMLKGDIKKDVKNSLEKDFSNITMKDYIDILTSNYNEYELCSACYENHRLKTYYYSYSLQRNTMPVVCNYLNKEASKSRASYWYISKADDFKEYLIENHPNEVKLFFDDDTFDEMPYEKYYYGSRFASIDGFVLQDALDFISNHQTENFDFQKPYFTLNGRDGGRTYLFYSNDMEGLYNILKPRISVKNENEEFEYEEGV